jgi:hypothetical protein
VQCSGCTVSLHRSTCSTHWSEVTSFCMTPAKLDPMGFTLNMMGNKAPERWRPNTVRVVFMTLCA